MKIIGNPRKDLHPGLSRGNVEDAVELIDKMLD